MQPRHGQGRLAGVDAGHVRPKTGEGLGEQSATATDVQRCAAGHFATGANALHPRAVDVVQRLELALRIPPLAGEGLELGDLGFVGIGHGDNSRRQNSARVNASSMSRVW